MSAMISIDNILNAKLSQKIMTKNIREHFDVAIVQELFLFLLSLFKDVTNLGFKRIQVLDKN